jgi:hypothetical protein
MVVICRAQFQGGIYDGGLCILGIVLQQPDLLWYLAPRDGLLVWSAGWLGYSTAYKCVIIQCVNLMLHALHLLAEQKLPDIKIMLFGRSLQRKHIDSDI